MKTQSPLSRTAWIIVALTLVPVFAFSQTDVLTNLAARIAEKRSRVETLSNQVELAKTQYNEELRSVATQVADVEIQINREELRLEQMDEEIERAASSIRRAEESTANVAPLVESVLVQFRTYINGALPFQREERLRELDSLERVYRDGTIDAATALARLWNMVESEFRLASESGIYRQNILVNGEYQLAEVARLGAVLLYFKTFDDRYGYAVPAGNDWHYRVAGSRNDEEEIAALFDSLRRNLREGYFTLHNPYATQEVQ